MEEKIHEEIKEFIAYIETLKGEAFDFMKTQCISTLNIIYSPIFGKRFKSDDPIGEYIVNEILTHIELLNPVFELFPITRYIPKYWKQFKALIPRSETYEKLIRCRIEECLYDTDEEENFVKEFIKTAGSNFDQSEMYFIIHDLLAGVWTRAPR